ncbi:exonuclease subunit SbcC [Staphylococcus massiliensis]|uniref:exonuclease subunit SbcC n=1 Tax=Staphylococcus massiliensis TaxID=555791 RepID=UPI001EE1197D|nr:exonuclease subunit SbcC [Staphylococcus massiliensis]MCG3398647.1 SMC family ATPase [Staphylococcus massiliensis]
MKPLKLKMKNFGPFINEEIDFSFVDDTRLFLISGKTGSGKTMIFDAIVFALFNSASTEDRKESDLRSHFVKDDAPMQVYLEFKLNDIQYKIFRQGKYLKEGRKSYTNGKLEVYEMINGEYELRESQINKGNAYIQSLLGVDVKQFRQLFILPQGEFKKFLLSKSSEKQVILRTLFKTDKFEKLQQLIKEDAAGEKDKIEREYNMLEIAFKDLEDFGEEDLISLKQLSPRQTEKIKDALDEFKQVGQAKVDKLTQIDESNRKNMEHKKAIYDEQQKLHEKIHELQKVQREIEQMKAQENEIKELELKLKRFEEIQNLINFIDQSDQAEKERTVINNDLEKTQAKLKELKATKNDYDHELKSLIKHESMYTKRQVYLDETRYYFNNRSRYENAFENIESKRQSSQKVIETQSQINQELGQLKKELAQNRVDHEEINQLFEHISALKQESAQIEANRDAYKKYMDAIQNIDRLQRQLEDVSKQINDLEDELKSFNSRSFDLSNKKALIESLQSMLAEGDTCPVCGHEIDNITSHVNYDEIASKEKTYNNLKRKLDDFNQTYSNLLIELKQYEVKRDENPVKEEPKNNDQDLKQRILESDQKRTRLLEQQELKEKLKNKINDKQKQAFDKEIELKDINSEIKVMEEDISAFKKDTGHNDVDSFIEEYNSLKAFNEEYETKRKHIEGQLQHISTNIEIAHNSIEHYTNNLSNVQAQIKTLDDQIRRDMEEKHIKSLDEIGRIKEELANKDQVLRKVNEYRTAYNNLMYSKTNLEASVQDKPKLDLNEVKAAFEASEDEKKISMKQLNEMALVRNQNIVKLDKIDAIIKKLHDELKYQEMTVKLSEIFSGKNPKKLTLENFVLIEFLESILEQANIRFMKMTNQRYQLVRREDLSQGLSGLEIEVFDAHSNKTRHISSLSGGETFQASLALALGLSEVIQHESGGISLDAMFIDEGFGTLDEETLSKALDALLSLKSSGRLVGVISHVQELKQRMPIILEVNNENIDSKTTFKINH